MTTKTTRRKVSSVTRGPVTLRKTITITKTYKSKKKK